MDTGLGAKAYAIIEQGKIGLILSSRPTDRRQLIEEAAGVTKYKARRRAAELKLEAAQQNLTRDRRHRLRGREAARDAQAAGGEGASLQEAARRAAALGEGAVRAEVPPAGGDHRVGAGATRRRARARDGGGGAAGRGRGRSRPPSHRARRIGSRVRRPRAKRRTRASSTSTAASSRSRSTRSRSRRCACAAEAMTAELSALEARREPARAAARGAA